MLKNFLLVVGFAVICLGAGNASASWWWGSFFDWNQTYSYDSSYDGGRSCNPVPEPSGALLFAAGGLVFAASKRRNRCS